MFDGVAVTFAKKQRVIDLIGERGISVFPFIFIFLLSVKNPDRSCRKLRPLVEW